MYRAAYFLFKSGKGTELSQWREILNEFCN